jgi:hypothetical protein
MNNPNKKILKKYNSEFENSLTKLTGEYVNSLHADLQKYCSMYDYRSNKENLDWGTSRDSVERSIFFLNGRHYSND